MSLKNYIFLLFALNYVAGKTHTKSLTESMGQEVIEIANPIKELPQELEEEPSAENEDVKLSTIPPATKKEFKGPALSDPSKKVKDIDKIDGRRQEDDEAKIEKELADIYKDSIDYKADSAEVTKLNRFLTNATTTSAASQETSEPSSQDPAEPEDPADLADAALRGSGRHQFKFAPDSHDPREVARFRTSIDEISCNTRLSATKEPGEEKAAGTRLVGDIFFLFSYVILFKISTILL